MKLLIDILCFNKMIAPFILQLMFWTGIGGTVYGTYVLIQLENWAWPLALFFGVLTTRVIFEGAMLAFRAYDRLGQISDALSAIEGSKS